MSDLRPPERIHHLAHPTFDTAETHRFYTRVLGLRLIGASDGESAAWGRRRFLHTSYATESGEVLSFFEVDGLSPPPADALPPDIRHVALRVESPAALEKWRERLETLGVRTSIERHGQYDSLYFRDPNGIQLELTASPCERQEQQALDVLRRWQHEHGRPAPD